MRCSLKNKSKTKHIKRGRLLIHIPGVWPNPSQETSNVHEYRERLHVLLTTSSVAKLRNVL